MADLSRRVDITALQPSGKVIEPDVYVQCASMSRHDSKRLIVACLHGNVAGSFAIGGISSRYTGIDNIGIFTSHLLMAGHCTVPLHQ